MSQCDDLLKRIYALQRLGIKPGLGRIKKLLKALGDPHRSYPSVHVAGTNGKGSTSAILHSILSKKYATGLYTSPHLERFNERIRVSGRLIKDSEIVKTAEAVEEAAKKTGLAGRLTFFEFTTAMAFLYFRVKKVDIAVIETGMGGRWDSTNVVTPLVSVITNVAHDHMEFLGPDIRAIAFEKAGIIKKGVPIVTGAGKKAALKVIKDAAKKRNSLLLRLGMDFKAEPAGKDTFDYSGMKWGFKGLSVNLIGAHQYKNSACALSALEVLSGRFEVTERMIRRGLKDVLWPGRVEVLRRRPLIILDSAHNPDGASALKDALEGFRFRHLILVLGVMADKDIGGIVKLLVPQAKTVVVTRVDTPRAASTELLAKKIRPYGKGVIVTASVKDACRAAVKEAGRNDAVCVTGSVFTVAEARSFLKRFLKNT